MTFMPWTSELELGIEEIDNQHKELVRLANVLHDEISGPAPQREAIGAVLEGLVDYTHNPSSSRKCCSSSTTTRKPRRTRHSTTALRARPWIC